MGSISAQYKQIGNAVPVNLAHAMGKKLIALLNNISKRIEVVQSTEKENSIRQLNLFDQSKKHNKSFNTDQRARAFS
jgi:DNA (cytosine-5)-methyltransferase 1